MVKEPVNHEAQGRLLEVPASEAAPFPSPLSSAIILTFAIKEIVPLVIPPHLPQTRAAALVANRSGPTLVDMQATLQCKTPLFADTRSEFDLGNHTLGIPNARLHDPEFCMLARSNDIFAYLPGTLSGVWEGSYLVRQFMSPYHGHMAGAESEEDIFHERYCRFRLSKADAMRDNGVSVLSPSSTSSPNRRRYI